MGIKFLGVVNNEVDRMTRIVTDLLLLSRIDYSQTEWRKTPFHIDALVKETVEKFMLEAEKQNLTLTYEKSSIVPVFTGDRDRMEQVITNILSNAVKYTPEGGSISVYAGHVLGETYIKVKDTGIGIPKDDLKRIFERFYRVDKTRSRAMGGTGLGLAIAKEIMLIHKGDLTAESVYGYGTTMTMHFRKNLSLYEDE